MACETFYNYYDTTQSKFICTDGSYLTDNKTTKLPVVWNTNWKYSLNYSNNIIDLPSKPCGNSFNDKDVAYCSPGVSQLSEDLQILKNYINKTK